MPGERTGLRWDRARHARCPERSTQDTWLHFGVLIGTIQRHECRNDDLHLVFGEFPILGPESTLAARAALASRAQGLYEPFHRALLGADGPFDLDLILAVARSVGLDAERLARDMKDTSLDALIARNAILANALGVRGTPAFVIGVVERPLLTLCNAARSMDHRADRHPIYAPINSHGRPAPTVTGERDGRGSRPPSVHIRGLAQSRTDFAVYDEVGDAVEVSGFAV